MPAKTGGTLEARVSASFQQLVSAAANLNRISDNLGSAVRAIDRKLNELKLGIPAWVTFDEVDKEPVVIVHQLGYCRMPIPGNVWGIAIRSVTYGEDSILDESDPRAFNDAPRDQRLKSVPMLPELIERLAKEVNDKFQMIAPIAAQARAFEKALNVVDPLLAMAEITDDEVPF